MFIAPGAAVRYREPRRILQQIVVAALAVTAAGCVEAVIDNDCVDTVDRSFQLGTPADLALQLKIDRCRIDVDACTDLCREALEINNVPREMPTACSVAFHDAGIEVNVSYEVFTGGDSCPVDAPEPIPPFMTGTGLLDGPQVRGLDARTFDSIWNGGRPCHA